MDLEKLKKVTLISFIVTVVSFILMLITRYKFPSIWFVARAIIFISGIVYLVAITGCTIVAKKNKIKLTGWLGALQGITIGIVIVGIIGMISMIQMDNKQEQHYKQAEQELRNNSYTTTIDSNQNNDVKLNNEINMTSTSKSVSSYGDVNETTKNVSIKKEIDIKDPDTYITNNPISEQTKFYPNELANYAETYNTRDILALMSAKNYVEQERNVYKIKDITLCQKDNYGRYRIMVVYYTPSSNNTNISVVYVYMSQKVVEAKMFFEYNTIIPNTNEWNTPLSF